MKVMCHVNHWRGRQLPIFCSAGACNTFLVIDFFISYRCYIALVSGYRLFTGFSQPSFGVRVVRHYVAINFEFLLVFLFGSLFLVYSTFDLF